MRALFFFIFFVSVLLMPLPSYAQQELEIMVSATPMPTPGVVYEMPYPGLLPDSPLYFLKTTRDNIIGFLITDPSKKAAFDLLQADKRFQAGIMLFQKDQEKRELAFSTISKGHNYLDSAIAKASEAKKHKVETADIASKIGLSLKKQQQVLGQLALSHPVAKDDVEHALQRLTALQNKAKQNRLIR